jgi:hypothetical protein
MGFYDDMQGIAAGVLAQFNQGVIRVIKLTKGTGPVYNPGTPSEVATVLPGAVAKGVEKTYIDRGLAVGSDKQVTSSVNAAALSVSMADILEIDGQPLRVVNIVKIPAAGTPVVLVFIARK